MPLHNLHDRGKFWIVNGYRKNKFQKFLSIFKHSGIFNLKKITAIVVCASKRDDSLYSFYFYEQIVFLRINIWSIHYVLCFGHF